MNRAKPFLYLFFLFALLNILGEAIGSELIRIYTKPFLMPLLGVWFAQNTYYHTGKWRSLVLGAIIFSLLGDSMLMVVENPSMGGDTLLFVAGLAAFAVSHLLYGKFFALQYPEGKRAAGRTTGLQAIFFIGFLTTALVILPAIDDLQMWPYDRYEQYLTLSAVIAYSVIILAVAYLIVGLRAHLAPDLHRMLLLGIGLYLFSDTLIAVGKFVFPGMSSQIIRPIIMATYLAAQYLLVRGAGEIILEKVVPTDAPTPQNAPSDRPL